MSAEDEDEAVEDDEDGQAVLGQVVLILECTTSLILCTSSSISLV